MAPLAEFPRNKRTADGHAVYCKPCHNARSAETRQRLYGGGREYHLRRRYGIGQAHVERILAMQSGRCPGCGKPDPEHVDHDHETGEVRGLLCFNCNQALGNVRDDTSVLLRLAHYLHDARVPLEDRLAAFDRGPLPPVFVQPLPPAITIELAAYPAHDR